MKLVSANAELVLRPEIGGTIASWTVGGVSMFRPAMADASDPRDQGSYPLVPFSNRIAGRCFTFRGQRYELPALLNGFAIHGAAWQCAWTQDGNHLKLDYPGGTLWPFAFSTEQVFDLSDDGLVVTMRITNRHHEPAPAALGMHPYFPRTPEMTLQFCATSVWQNGSDNMPSANTQIPPAWDFSKPRRPADIAVDNCFAGWHRSAVFTWPEHDVQLTMSADTTFRHLVVYFPQNAAFCAVEPVANMNDGINRMGQHVDHGMTVLAPGETLAGVITFKVARV